MPVYLYAICDARAPAPDAHGLESIPLRVVRCERLAALVSDRREAAPATAGPEELWEHERVVEALMEGHDLLPVRFGTVLDSDAEVAELLGERSEQLGAALAHVAGAAELAVRAICASEPSSKGPATATAQAGAGRAYLAERLGAQQRASSLADRIDRELHPLAKARRLRIPTATRAAMSAAYLVARERVGEFVGRVSALDAQSPDAHVLCTGPWPPYSFSEGDAPV